MDHTNHRQPAAALRDIPLFADLQTRPATAAGPAVPPYGVYRDTDLRQVITLPLPRWTGRRLWSCAAGRLRLSPRKVRRKAAAPAGR